MKHWPNILALIVIYIAVLMGWQWVWGVLFIMWTIPALYSREVTIIRPVARSTNPFLYWIIVCTWIGLSLYLIVADLVPFLQALFTSP